MRAAECTLGSLGQAQLRALGEALGLEHERDRNQAVFDLVSATWSERPVDAAPRPSDITDDNTPYEFSIAFPPSSR